MHGRPRREGRDGGRRRARQRAGHARDGSARADGTVEQVHAIVLSGGSAFGLDAASGVMRYLEQQGIGFPFGGAVVPIVPAAILFDLGVGDPKIRPTADCGYAAAKAATDGPVAEGNVGAGAGATVGKMGGRGRAMKGGIGSAAITLPNGLVVAALVAVNAAATSSIRPTGRSSPACAPRTAGASPTCAAASSRASSICRARSPPAHDARRRRHQRDADQDAGDEGRADGARRLRARDLSRAHLRRRRHDLRARDRGARPRPTISTRSARSPPR